MTNDPTVLAQRFFQYGDQVLRDAVAKNERLQAQNASMETAREKLVHMAIYNGRDNEEILKINLKNPVNRQQEQPQQQNDASHHLVYEVDTSTGSKLPYNEISRLRLYNFHGERRACRHS